MKRFLSVSFRNRLFIALLAASLIPLLICSALLLQIFRIQMTSEKQREADGDLASAAQILEHVRTELDAAAAGIAADPTLSRALAHGTDGNPVIYNRFLEVTASVRGTACLELYDAGGSWLYSTRNLPHGDTLPVSWGILYAAAGRGEPTFFPSDSSDSGGPRLAGAVPLMDGSGQPLGFLLATFYQTDLSALLDSAVSTSSDLILLSSYWRPVYCSQPGLTSSIADMLRSRLLAGQPLSSGPEEFTYSAARHEPTGLYIVLRQPQVFTRDTMSLLYAVSAIFALACIAAAVLLSLTLSRQLFGPVQRLHGAIEEVARTNNLDVYVQPEGGDEFGALAERFNEMLSALKRNQEQLVENQRELNEAQIRMLQAQLNPHFLCNTLDTMKWNSKINNVPQVAVMATDLADILRFCVSPDEFVPLSRELEIISRYVEIQRIRFSDSFSYSADVPDELADSRVPKMILQPIVENAILHGLEGVSDGAVEVSASAGGGILTIRVSDNGRGIPPELTGPYSSRGRELSRGHLGLYNVDTILRKYYGEGFGLYLENRSGSAGAVVTATLPLRYEKEDETC